MNGEAKFPRRALRHVAGALASVLFPGSCRLCGESLTTASRLPICSACLQSLTSLVPPGAVCRTCGLPAVSPFAETSSGFQCRLCRNGFYDFEFARSYGPYEAGLSKAILLLKYEQVLPLADWFAERLSQIAAQHRTDLASDVVVPVPSHAARLKERGSNHAELIARPLAKYLGLSLRPKLLVRIRPRPEKLRLSRHERWRTVQGAYAIGPGMRVDKLRVLLVDDVLTTGATLDACSRVLRRAGASKVVALTVGRAVPQSVMTPGAQAPAIEPRR